ncbi:MAG: hypothetical protein LQ340_006588, partial [Diploschistes diacapsis]
MERESFMSQEIADVLNASFIPVKIDREERPDIDAIYMNYVQATTGGGGWPLNVFITPDLEPVFGGTYFSGPSSTAGTGIVQRVGFADVLEKLRDVWATQEQKCRDSAKEITKQLRQFAEEGVHSRGSAKTGDQLSESLELDVLEEAYRTIAHQYDREHGGFSSAPKFPTPVRLRFLLQLGQWPSAVSDLIGPSDCAEAAAMAISTLRNMARGGIRDHIGYGFARYSVTRDWSLPHFEKMLYDQALLLDAYVDAFLLTHDAEMLGAIYDIATYLTSPPIARPEGGFFSSEDADSAPSRSDSEKREGAFYVWTAKEIQAILPPQEADIVTRFYNVRPNGNVAQEHDIHDELLNQNVLAIVSSPAALSKDLGIPEAQVISTLRTARTKLRQHRDAHRPQPGLDDKLVVSWNGLAISALSRASAALGTIDPVASASWLASAIKAAEFIRTHMWDAQSGVLWRIFRGTRGNIRGLADDYAAIVQAAIELYGCTFDESWLRWADELQKAQNRDFLAPEGGFYTTPNLAGSGSGSGSTSSASTGTPASKTPSETTGSDLLLRLKSGMDNAEPSANSLSCSNLFRLSSLLEDEQYAALARRTVMAFEAEIEQWPGSFPGLLHGVAWAAVGGKSVWIIGGDDDRKNDDREHDDGGERAGSSRRLLSGMDDVADEPAAAAAAAAATAATNIPEGDKAGMRSK